MNTAVIVGSGVLLAIITGIVVYVVMKKKDKRHHRRSAPAPAPAPAPASKPVPATTAAPPPADSSAPAKAAAPAPPSTKTTTSAGVSDSGSIDPSTLPTSTGFFSDCTSWYYNESSGGGDYSDYKTACEDCAQNPYTPSEMVGAGYLVGGACPVVANFSTKSSVGIAIVVAALAAVIFVLYKNKKL